MDEESRANDGINIDYKETVRFFTGEGISKMLLRSLFGVSLFNGQTVNIKNSPVMITVDNELFCANSSSLLYFEVFKRMLQETTDFTTEGFPKLHIHRKSTYFMNILDYINGIFLYKKNNLKGIDFIQDITDVDILHGILEEANYFRLDGLSSKISAKIALLTTEHDQDLMQYLMLWISLILG
jgi:hypothetical protein